MQEVQKKRSAAGLSRRPKAATGSNEHQLAKSEKMQRRILEAALQCFLERGYAGATMTNIAQEAGVSLGAMIHHFQSRSELMKAVAGYVVEKRTGEYERLISDPRLHPPEVVDASSVTLEGLQQTMELLVKYYSLPSFFALQEMLTAAHTDQSLRNILTPLERELDKKISASIRTQFPYLDEIKETRDVLNDVIHFALQGQSMRSARNVSRHRLKRMAEFLAQMSMREIHEAHLRR